MGAVPELTLVEWLRLSRYSLPGPNRTYSQGDTAPGWGCLVKPPLNTKSMGESSPQETPTHTTSKQNFYCGSHLLSHTHQDAVPSTPQGLAHQVRKGYWAFPPSYHHRKTTKQQPTPQKNGAQACCFKTIQRTQTPQTTIV